MCAHMSLKRCGLGIFFLGSVALMTGCVGGNASSNTGDATGGPGVKLTVPITQIRAGTINVENGHPFPVYVYVDGRPMGTLGPFGHSPVSVVQGSHTITLFNAYRQQVEEFDLSTDDK